MPWLLMRMDEMQDVMGFTAESTRRPSEYFESQMLDFGGPGR